MEIDLGALLPRDAYRLMTALLVPRPIAWVSTLDAEGRANLAPFSFCGGVSSHPPLLMLAVGRRRGRQKDTAGNLLARGEAVVHVAHRALAERMVGTSAEVGPEVDEFDLAGLTKAPSRLVAPPRVAEALVALEARLERHLEVGEGGTDLFLLHVLCAHVDDEVVVDGVPDPARLRAVGRLGGTLYCDTAAPFSIPRP